MVAKAHPMRLWVEDRLAELGVEALLADGFDSAIMGVVEVDNNYVVAYSTSKIIAKLVAEGLTLEDAYDHFYYNIACAYLGPTTPIYVEDPCDF